MTTNRQWLLSARPDGMIGPQNFSYAETDVPEIGDGDVLVKNLMFSFDPTQRNWMVDRPAVAARSHWRADARRLGITSCSLQPCRVWRR